MYINDIDHFCTILSFVLFADDTTVYVHYDAIQILILNHSKLLSGSIQINLQVMWIRLRWLCSPHNEAILRNEVVEIVNKIKAILVW